MRAPRPGRGPGRVYEIKVPEAGHDVGRNLIGTGTLKAPVDQGDDAVPSGQGDDFPPVQATADEFPQAVLFLPSQGMPGAEDEKLTFPLHAGCPPSPYRVISFLYGDARRHHNQHRCRHRRSRGRTARRQSGRFPAARTTGLPARSRTARVPNRNGSGGPGG